MKSTSKQNNPHDHQWINSTKSTTRVSQTFNTSSSSSFCCRKKSESPPPSPNKKNILSSHSPPLKTPLTRGWKTLGVSEFPAPSWISIKRVVFVMPALLPRASADPGTSTTPWSRTVGLGGKIGWRRENFPLNLNWNPNGIYNWIKLRWFY